MRSCLRSALPSGSIDASSKTTCRGSLAWAEGLERARVISAADGSAIRTALLEILSRERRDQGFLDSDAARQDEDVHAFVERELSARVGDAGRRLHTGRSRNEQVAVDLRLYLKRRVPRATARPSGADCAGLPTARPTPATR